jgi:hypothetical protein
MRIRMRDAGGVRLKAEVKAENLRRTIVSTLGCNML